MNVYAIVVGVVIGVLLAFLTPVSIYFFLQIGVLATLALIFSPRVFIALTLGLFLFGISLGGIRVLFGDANSTAFDDALGTRVSLEGTIVSELDVRDTQQRFTFRTDDTNILVSTDPYIDLTYGDVVYVSGVLKKPEAFTTDTGRVFRYDTFLEKDNIFYQISFADVVVRTQGGWSIQGTLFAIKNFFVRNIHAAIPEPAASLGAGITVGAKQSLGDALLHVFQVTGLIHIVVLSGYNVTIIGEALLRILSGFSRRIALSIGAVLIILFVIMVGAQATILRAGGMALLALLARATGRTYLVTKALFLVGALMILIHPKILIYDPSFQLSFIATLGLIYVAPRIEARISFISSRFGVREIIAATVGTQLAVLPLLLHMTGILSLSSLLVNVLVLPLVPLAMLLTFVAGLVGFIPGSEIIGLPAYVLLSYMTILPSWFASLPLSYITVPPFSFSITVLLYALGIGFLWVSQKQIQGGTHGSTVL